MTLHTLFATKRGGLNSNDIPEIKIRFDHRRRPMPVQLAGCLAFPMPSQKNESLLVTINQIVVFFGF